MCVVIPSSLKSSLHLSVQIVRTSRGQTGGRSKAQEYLLSVYFFAFLVHCLSWIFYRDKDSVVLVDIRVKNCCLRITQSLSFAMTAVCIYLKYKLSVDRESTSRPSCQRVSRLPTGPSGQSIHRGLRRCFCRRSTLTGARRSRDLDGGSQKRGAGVGWDGAKRGVRVHGFCVYVGGGGVAICRWENISSPVLFFVSYASSHLECAPLDCVWFSVTDMQGYILQEFYFFSD